MVELKKLPPLSVPLDYPACLDRITEAAHNRVVYEIQNDMLMQLSAAVEWDDIAWGWLTGTLEIIVRNERLRK